MAQYASSVPKPRTVKKKSAQSEEDSYDGYGRDKDTPLSILEQLEAKHRQDQLAVAAIRKEYGMNK